MKDLIEANDFDELSGNIGTKSETYASPVCSCDCAPCGSPQCSCPPVDCASCRANDFMTTDTIWGL